MTPFKDMSQDFAEAHRIVDTAPSPNPLNRVCGGCERELRLTKVRGGVDRWYYRHIEDRGCQYDKIGNKIVFHSIEEAERADVVFKW